MRTGLVVAPVPGEHRRDAHNVTCCRRVDLETASDVDPDVGNVWFVPLGEKDGVSWLRLTHESGCVELVDGRSTVGRLFNHSYK